MDKLIYKCIQDSDAGTLCCLNMLSQGVSAHRKEPGDIAQLVGLQPMDEAVLLAEALLKQLLVGAVDVAEPLAQVTVVTARSHGQI